MKDAPNPDGAELLVEYLTSREVHEMFRESGWFPCRVDVDGPHGMPSADALDLKFVSAPSIGMSREDIAGRFHKMLQGLELAGAPPVTVRAAPWRAARPIVRRTVTDTSCWPKSSA